MTRTLAEADGVCRYQPPSRVPPGPGRKKPRKKRGMKRSMTWHDPSLLVNRSDKTSKKLQTETKLSAGGYRCNLCGYGRFASEVIMRKHQSSQACTQALRKEEKQRAKKQYRTMFMPGQLSSSSLVAAASGASVPTSALTSSLASSSSFSSSSSSSSSDTASGSANAAATSTDDDGLNPESVRDRQGLV